MADFKKLGNKKIETKKFKIKLEVEFQNSSLTLEELQDYLERYINDSYNKAFSNFIVDMLRITRSSTWDNGQIKVEI